MTVTAESRVRAAGAGTFGGLCDYLVSRFGPEAAAATIQPLGGDPDQVKEGGYGTPWLVEWPTPGGRRRLVLETVRAGGFGHEDRADRAALAVRALDDYGRLPRHVVAVDAGVLREGAPPLSLHGGGEFFLLTEFSGGEPYADDLERIAAEGAARPRDRKRARLLAEYLAAIHREPVRYPTYYRRRLRDLTGSGECLAGVADSYPTEGGAIPASLLQRIESLALAWRYRLRDRSDRLRTIHGDFHPWNILFEDDDSFTLLDRSRGPWGDPADDVAALSVNYVFFAERTAGAFDGPFAELFRLFWAAYHEASPDSGLAEVIAPFYAFRVLVLASPLWYPNESEKTRERLVRFLVSILEAPRFEPDRIPAYLDGRPG